MDKVAKVICISSVNGGVGKTIFTLNLAGVFKNLNKKVLILDFDFYSGGISIALNQSENNNLLNLVNDIKKKNIDDVDNYVTNYCENIDYVASIKNPNDARKVKNSSIEKIINIFKNFYDIILIDTNHLIDDVKKTLLSYADLNLFMMVNDPFNIKNMKTCLTLLNEKNVYNYELILNDAIDYCNNYFSKKEIEDILNNEIKYVISPASFIKNIDTLILNGEIITLQKAYQSTSDYNIYLQIVTDFLGDDK